MQSPDLLEVFTSTKSELSELGIQQGFFLDLISTRLVIERLGESDNLEWWDSRVLSETGRTRLAEVTPKTKTKARVNLALQIGRKSEADRIPNEGISLFSFGPQIESKIAAEVESIGEDESVTFGSLESLSVQSLDSGWGRSIIEEITENRTDTTAPESQENSGSNDTILLSDSGYTQREVEENKREILTNLLQAYGNEGDRLRVPYYPLETETERT